MKGCSVLNKGQKYKLREKNPHLFFLMFRKILSPNPFIFFLKKHKKERRGESSVTKSPPENTQ